MNPFKSYMGAAMALAQAAADAGEPPVGAVVVDPIAGAIVGRGANAMACGPDPTAHAEIQAIRDASAALGRARLDGLDLWVTLEPCAMCAGAIAHARIRRLYYAADDPKGGAVAHGPRVFAQATTHWRPEIYSGDMAEASARLLRAFFIARRGGNKDEETQR